MRAGYVPEDQARERHTSRTHFWRWLHRGDKQAVGRRGADDREHGWSYQGVSLPRGAEKWGWGSQGKLLLFCFTSIGTNIFRIVCKPRMSMVTNEKGKQGDARQGGLSKTFKAIEFWLEQQGTVESLSRTVWQEEKNHILKRISCLEKKTRTTTEWIGKESK